MNRPDSLRPRRSKPAPSEPANETLPIPERVALVLQGAARWARFRGGVVEALHERAIPIHWVAGISIGAVNAALIAGNPPERRLAALKAFWEQASSAIPNMFIPDQHDIREAVHVAAAAMVATFGVPGFFRPNSLPSWLAPAGSAPATSLYDTMPLAATLDDLVDWDLLNEGPTRISVGAVDVESGNFVYFDTHCGPLARTQANWADVDACGLPTRIDARHIMASGALPPGFPAVEIDGRHYWDGGIVSNTPLQHVLDHQDCVDMLVFQVDLFPAEGPLPLQLTDVLNRQKDIQYSSRTRQVTDQYLRLRREHERVRRLLAKLPPELANDPDVEALKLRVDSEAAVNIVHLIYRSREWETGARDFEFSRNTMVDHWQQGCEAVTQSIRHGDVLASNILNGRTAAFDLGD